MFLQEKTKKKKRENSIAEMKYISNYNNCLATK